MWWSKNISCLKGIGPKKQEDFKNLNIETLGDLLNFFPKQDEYIDYSNIKKIKDLSVNNKKQITKAIIVNFYNKFSINRKKYTHLVVKDETGFLETYLFSYQAKNFKKDIIGNEILLSGKISMFRGKKVVKDATIKFINSDKSDGFELGIIPNYKLSGSLNQNNIRNFVQQALIKAKENLKEILPNEIIKAKNFMPRYEAFKNIHFPKDFISLKQAKERLVYEELFSLQCCLLYYKKKNNNIENNINFSQGANIVNNILNNLNFVLTNSQKKAWQEISANMERPERMNRLLQGDVGAGKTIIAALAMAKCVANGYQACIMVPTEILARQHFTTLKEYYEKSKIKVGLLIGNISNKEKKALLEELKEGKIDVIVGTHAIIQKDVEFKNLGLTITDEQHRFGVLQRTSLVNKALKNPDVLIMTATPIPRTLSLTIYGDLDISVIKGMPNGRKKIKTLCYTEEKRAEVYEGLVRLVKQNGQAYIVCPLIEESENFNSKSVLDVYEELKNSFLTDIKCELLYGKMSGKEKEDVISRFFKGEVKVLISTTVVEVGVNVPNATLMIIENADRFGLAQLHQLRGRVGRGSKQSYCVLLTNSGNETALERLKTLKKYDDGFILAEKDLLQRGMGEIFGNKQHGLPDLYIADLVRDREILIEIRAYLEKCFEKESINENIKEILKEQFNNRFEKIFYS